MYLRQVPRTRPPGQAWATYRRNRAHATWAGDPLRVTDPLFRPLFASFLVAPASRRVVHAGVTRHSADAWVARPLREATPHGEHPRFPDRDNVPSMAHASRSWPRQAASPSCARRSGRRAPTRSPNGSRRASGGSASITRWSRARATSAACSTSTSPTSTRAGHTKGATGAPPEATEDPHAGSPPTRCRRGREACMCGWVLGGATIAHDHDGRGRLCAGRCATPHPARMSGVAMTGSSPATPGIPPTIGERLLVEVGIGAPMP